jgi:hypothetical protein
VPTPVPLLRSEGKVTLTAHAQGLKVGCGPARQALVDTRLCDGDGLLELRGLAARLQALMATWVSS